MGIFFVLIVGFGAAALGKRFRLYSIATLAVPARRTRVAPRIVPVHFSQWTAIYR